LIHTYIPGFYQLISQPKIQTSYIYASYQRVQVKYLISCQDNFRAEYVRTRAIIRVSTRDNGEGEARAGICNLWYELRVFILAP